MPDKDSTTQTKPGKPYDEFPLYAHACGQWPKKIRGKTHFFGSWRDYHAALLEYLNEKDDLEARRPVRASVTPDDAVSAQELSLLLWGIDPSNVKRQKRYQRAG